VGATVQESEWAKGQKETRIIDTLEPVMTQHRLVVAESFLRDDVTTEDSNSSFLYQLTDITKDRGALTTITGWAQWPAPLPTSSGP
jgi:hypothetical protein